MRGGGRESLRRKCTFSCRGHEWIPVVVPFTVALVFTSREPRTIDPDITVQEKVSDSFLINSAVILTQRVLFIFFKHFEKKVQMVGDLLARTNRSNSYVLSLLLSI